jgi:putative DNA methylase
MNQEPGEKLIEIALSLPEVDDASACDMVPGIGLHPKGIHHWWALPVNPDNTGLARSGSSK